MYSPSQPEIPPDLADSWEWQGTALKRIGEPLLIAWPAPRCFDEARAYEAAWARRQAERKPKQTEMELDL